MESGRSIIPNWNSSFFDELKKPSFSQGFCEPVFTWGGFPFGNNSVPSDQSSVSNYPHAPPPAFEDVSPLRVWVMWFLSCDSSTSSWDILPSNRPAPTPRSLFRIMTPDPENIHSDIAPVHFPQHGPLLNRPFVFILLSQNPNMSVRVLVSTDYFPLTKENSVYFITYSEP